MPVAWRRKNKETLIHGYHSEGRLPQIARLSIGAIIIISIYQEHHYIEVLEHQRLQVQAGITDENLERRLSGVSNAFAGVLDDLPNWDSKISGAADVAHRLRDFSAAMPGD